MYREFETRTSYHYLKTVIEALDEPVCILGGWAVFFHVNERFEKAQGRPYLGSRDIDLGFHMGSDLKNSALAKTIKTLTGKLKFKPQSFRLVKEIHTETEEELADSTKVPAHFIFPMYVDLIVDSIPSGFRHVFGFDPIDEPLLRLVFDKKQGRIMEEFDKKLLLPSNEALLAMKINSLPGRDKKHKRIKDMCDIFALTWYSGLNPSKVDLKVNLPKSSISKFSTALKKEDYFNAAVQLGHEAEEIKRILELILEPK